MASNLWNECSLEKEGNPSIYLLTGKTETFVNEGKKIRKFEIGSASTFHVQEKVVMFVGETGTGKTTLINTIANYLLGIKWEDNGRFKVMPDEDERRQTSEIRGQTRWITSYTFHQTKTLSYKVTLVDTPGFGDTDGRYTDSFITSQVREFFTSRGDGGVDHIDAVAFVLKASSTRLTSGQSNVFKSVLGLFGKDIACNIFLFITHAEGTEIDNDDAPVIRAVEAAEFPFAGYLICNNIVLYHQKDKKSELAQSTDRQYKAIWTAVGNNLKKFFDELQAFAPKSISLSARVLEEKRNNEIIVQGLLGLITSCIVEMNKIKKAQLVVERYKDEMRKNQDFYYQVEEERVKEISLEEGKKATVCTHCKRTCHFPCKKDLFISIGGIRMCSAMRWFPEFRGCGVCLMHCAVSHHQLGSIKYEREIVTVTRTNEEIKERYNIAKRKMNDHKFVIDELERHKEKLQKDIDKCVTRLRDSLERLNRIAWKSDPSLLLRVLEAMKEKESREMQPGWIERISKLDEIYRSEKERLSIRRAATGTATCGSPSRSTQKTTQLYNFFSVGSLKDKWEVFGRRRRKEVESDESDDDFAAHSA